MILVMLTSYHTYLMLRRFVECMCGCFFQMPINKYQPHVSSLNLGSMAPRHLKTLILLCFSINIYINLSRTILLLEKMVLCCIFFCLLTMTFVKRKCKNTFVFPFSIFKWSNDDDIGSNLIWCASIDFVNWTADNAVWITHELPYLNLEMMSV